MTILDRQSAGQVVPSGLASPRPQVPGWVAVAFLVAAVLVVAVGLPAEQADWQQVDGPPAPVIWNTLIATPNGFAVASQPSTGGARIWSSGDGREWRSNALSLAPARLTVFGERLVAWDTGAGVLLEPLAGQWRESAEILFPDDLRIGARPGQSGVTGSATGLIVESVYGEVFWSGDGESFEQVDRASSRGQPGLIYTPCRPGHLSSPEVPPMIVTESGFFALIGPYVAADVGRWPVCEPQVWVSDSGRTWSRLTEESPFGSGAFVHDVAWHDGTYVAIGGVGIDRPVLWSSVDGIEWEQRPAPLAVGSYELRNIEAGEAGWLLLGQRTQGPGFVAWASRDSRCWEPVPDRAAARVGVVGHERMMLVDPLASSPWIGLPTGEGCGAAGG